MFGRIVVAAFVSLVVVAPAFALNPKDVIESCRNSVGKPIVMACMKGGGGNLEACREKAKPKVQACVQAAMEKSLPKEAGSSTAKVEAAPSAEDMAKAAPTSLVAPPRTVSDITAILDQQKPDPARVAQLQATADAEPAADLKGLPLADFYYKRGAGAVAAWPQRRSAGRRRTGGQQCARAPTTTMSSAATNSF